VIVTQNTSILRWGGTLQYSMPYLKSAVVDLGLSAFVNHLIPIVIGAVITDPFDKVGSCA
jgi:hypothetical protein